MKYVVSCDLAKFEAWSGGKDSLDTLKKYPDALEYVSNYLDELSECDFMSDIDINDWLWFSLDEYVSDYIRYDDMGDWGEEHPLYPYAKEMGMVK